MTEVFCKGSFMLGSACGTCAKCQQNLDDICRMTGLVRREEYDRVVEKLTKLAADVLNFAAKEAPNDTAKTNERG